MPWNLKPYVLFFLYPEVSVVQGVLCTVLLNQVPVTVCRGGLRATVR